MARTNKQDLKSLKEIRESYFYSTGEARDLFKALGLPYSKPWLYDLINNDKQVKDMFVRPNETGYRYIRGDNLKQLVARLSSGI